MAGPVILKTCPRGVPRCEQILLSQQGWLEREKERGVQDRCTWVAGWHSGCAYLHMQGRTPIALGRQTANTAKCYTAVASGSYG